MTTPQATSEAPPRARAAYRHWVTIPIRFGDQDPMGHVNNAVISTYFEQSRCIHVVPSVARANDPELDFVLARIVIDYLREMKFPGSVDVGLRIGHIGNKSLTADAAIFNGDECCATSVATLVFFNTRTRRSMLPPPIVRAALEEMR